MQKQTKWYNELLQIGIPFLWAGFVLAISFMEAPLKFTAPGITLDLGLGIGRIIFFTLNKIELVLMLVLGFSYLSFRRTSKNLLFLVIPAFILTLQTLWLLPALDQRAIMILNGENVPSSSLHIVYIFLEAAKVITLLILGVANAKAFLKR